jgi:cyclic pyranopterin monophosphate synthase
MTLTHVDASGAARMVDISAKPATRREAVTEGFITIAPATLAKIAANQLAKGDVIATARIAGIMAAKRTAELIPLCHPLPIDAVTLELAIEATGIRVTSSVVTTFGTGVEMEALTATSVALLTVYDMAKASDRAMMISDIRLLRKSGGRSGDWQSDTSRTPRA